MEETFVDGLNKIHFTGGLVRIDFSTLYPESMKPNLRLIMNPQQAITLRDTLNALLQKLPGSPVPQGKALEERYNPNIFSVSNIDEAKRIILTKEGSSGSEERWQKETPALMRMLSNYWRLLPGTKIVDYGCGIGRISKELCALGCQVIGVDISPEMRKLAVQYVNNDKFSVVSPDDFVEMIKQGFRCDYACAIWVLQHCLKPWEDLGSILSALKNGGELFVVNNKFSRAVPVVDATWQNDGIDIWQMCRSSTLLHELRVLGFPEGVGVDARYFQCGFYQQQKGACKC